MPVIPTQKLLYKISELCKQQSKNQLAEVQREMIVSPLLKLFPQVPQEALYYELLNSGLFKPQEWMALDDTVKQLEERDVWGIVKKEYRRLKPLWDGPKVRIYIYPLTNNRPTFDGITANKNGVAFNKALFLFVTTDLAETELTTLFVHEYHHICRLFYLNKTPQEMLLKDSVVLEGMAEWAVEELYGEKSLSPWAKRYSYEEALMIWKQSFVPALNVRGVGNHHSYLYGDRKKQLPKCIGYCIGYYIVQSYLKNKGPVEQSILCKIPTDNILAGSDFLID
ncbi:DUF2268 domain-containing protein [Lysinibacillus sp. LZ02]|uniref:DUF2268 domain-containing protein n=1 Tax=Lysinibacillus sp. LZ02 TaxID=3420668 RepID=UPI003D365A7E